MRPWILLPLALAFPFYPAIADWPHPLGPQSNGMVGKGEPIPAALPEEAEILWSIPATDGYAAPIVVKDRVIFGDYQKRKEVFHALDMADGKPIWSDVLDDPHKDGFGTGPRCAPVSDGEIVLTQSCKGELHCLSLETGKLLWRKNYQKDFGAHYAGETGKTQGGARHGYNASPCIDGEHVITLASGPGAGIVCLEKKTGEVVWKSQDDQAAYSPPIVATIAGIEQVLCFTVQGALGLRRSNGELLWRVPLTTDYGRHIVAPVVYEDLVILGSHQVGLIATRLVNEEGKIKTEEVWKTAGDMGPNISTPLLLGDHLYYLGKKQVICLDARTGEKKWGQDGNVITEERRAFAAFIGLGETIMMLNAMGELILFEADPGAYKEIGRTQVCGKNWCHPAYSDGKLVVRDAKKLVCLALIKDPTKSLPQEQNLWPKGEFEETIQYADGEKMRAPKARADAPSGSNRVFSQVFNPTYAIHRPEKPNGVALVICPGGGYRDVWLDREGHDLALWLKPYGITSLVLKYRTNNAGFSDNVYLRAVSSDARRAISIMREQASDLKIDGEKIGICGYSAGGNLALQVLFHPGSEETTRPNFAGLFYPWFRTDDFSEGIANGKANLPIFMMNAADDKVTPTSRLLTFYQKLLEAKVSHSELHIVNQGGHGFDLGTGRGLSTELWKESFVRWLTDIGMMTLSKK